MRSNAAYPSLETEGMARGGESGAAEPSSGTGVEVEFAEEPRAMSVFPMNFVLLKGF
jgi:hypothetical protein